MGQWEAPEGATDEWYTPPYIFEALGARFDLDVAAPAAPTHVPARAFITADSLSQEWHGFVWMNPPFGGRNGIKPWLDKFFHHNNGIALAPDRTSAPWFQEAAHKATAVLFLSPKVRFLKPDGSAGVAPANGTALFAAGPWADGYLFNARRLGWLTMNSNS